MTTPARSTALGAVRADEAMPGPTLCRRLGVGRHTLSMMRRRGLTPIKLGKVLVYRGADVLALLDQLAAEQAAVARGGQSDG